MSSVVFKYIMNRLYVVFLFGWGDKLLHYRKYTDTFSYLFIVGFFWFQECSVAPVEPNNNIFFICLPEVYT